jgi:hypothetical protein
MEMESWPGHGTRVIIHAPCQRKGRPSPDAAAVAPSVS